MAKRRLMMAIIKRTLISNNNDIGEQEVKIEKKYWMEHRGGDCSHSIQLSLHQNYHQPHQPHRPHHHQPFHNHSFMYCYAVCTFRMEYNCLVSIRKL